MAISRKRLADGEAEGEGPLKKLRGDVVGTTVVEDRVQVCDTSERT